MDPAGIENFCCEVPDRLSAQVAWWGVSDFKALLYMKMTESSSTCMRASFFAAWLESGAVEGLVEQNADQRLAIFDASGVDQADHLGERGHAHLDLFILLRLSLSQRQVLGEQDGHGFGEKAWAGVVVGVAGPASGTIAGLLDKLSLPGGDQLFARLDAPRGQFEHELAGGVAILTNQQDAGILWVGLIVDGQHDNRTVVADEVAGGLYAAWFQNVIGCYPEGFACKDGSGGEGLSATTELAWSGERGCGALVGGTRGFCAARSGRGVRAGGCLPGFACHKGKVHDRQREVAQKIGSERSASSNGLSERLESVKRSGFYPGEAADPDSLHRSGGWYIQKTGTG